MKRILEAIIFATNKHQGQKRKYTGEDYIVHPLEVASLVSMTRDHTEDMIIAAVLHDTVEDCGVSNEEILNKFGIGVATLVEMLTDVSKKGDGNREKRREIDRKHTALASNDAKTIKLADLIDNTKSITTYDKDFARVYLKEKALLLEVLRGGDKVLWEIANKQVLTEGSKL